MTILVCSLPIVIIWIFGVDEDVDIAKLQNAIEVMIVLTALVSVIPRMMKKLKGDTLKHILGLFPTLAVLFVIAWKFPEVDPDILEMVAVVLVITNIITLGIVKKKLAKYFAKKTKEGKKNVGYIRDFPDQ